MLEVVQSNNDNNLSHPLISTSEFLVHPSDTNVEGIELRWYREKSKETYKELITYNMARIECMQGTQLEISMSFVNNKFFISTNLICPKREVKLGS
jgi:hypothetical protein